MTLKVSTILARTGLAMSLAAFGAGQAGATELFSSSSSEQQQSTRAVSDNFTPTINTIVTNIRGNVGANITPSRAGGINLSAPATNGSLDSDDGNVVLGTSGHGDSYSDPAGWASISFGTTEESPPGFDNDLSTTTFTGGADAVFGGDIIGGVAVIQTRTSGNGDAVSAGGATADFDTEVDAFIVAPYVTRFFSENLYADVIAGYGTGSTHIRVFDFNGNNLLQDSDQELDIFFASTSVNWQELLDEKWDVLASGSFNFNRSYLHSAQNKVNGGNDVGDLNTDTFFFGGAFELGYNPNENMRFYGNVNAELYTNDQAVGFNDATNGAVRRTDRAWSTVGIGMDYFIGENAITSFEYNNLVGRDSVSSWDAFANLRLYF